MQIDGLPVRIIARIKRAAIDIELVGKYKHQLFVVHVRLLGVGFRGGVTIDEAPVSWNIGDLAGGIDATKIETSLVRLFFLGEVS